MKKNLNSSLAATIILAFLFTACQKNGKDPYQPVEASHYRIEKIIVPADQLVAANRRYVHVPTAGRFMTYATQPAAQLPAAGNADTMVFAYNAAGNPVSVTHLTAIGENALFKYDKFNRLSDYINIYPNGAGDYWHRYTYDINNRIVADTAFRDFYAENGTIVDYGDIDLRVYQYDSYGRISQSTEYVLGDTIAVNYAYDVKGDLVNGYTYDNKLNTRLTHKIWSFVDRDYSLNNPLNTAIYTYNTAGLPLTINTNGSVWSAGLSFPGIGYPFSISKANIIYSYH